MVVWPEKLTGLCRMRAAMRSVVSRSETVPKSITSASQSAIKRSPSSAKRSGGQHFAEPYAAPGPKAIRNFPLRAPAACNLSRAVSIAAGAMGNRISSICGKASIHPDAPQQFEVVIHLMIGNFARLRDSDGPRQQNDFAHLARIRSAREFRRATQSRRRERNWGKASRDRTVCCEFRRVPANARRSQPAAGRTMRESQSPACEYKSATPGRASTVISASGQRVRIARNAGIETIASPTQLVARTRIFIAGRFRSGSPRVSIGSPPNSPPDRSARTPWRRSTTGSQAAGGHPN